MSKFDIVVLIILAVSIAFIFIGIWVADYPLSLKFISTGGLSFCIGVLFCRFVGEAESAH